MRPLRSVFVLCLACACAPIDEPTTTESHPLLSGEYTFERPEVGAIRVGGGACTATLFASARTVITAAHCVDYGSSSGPGNYGEFTITPREGETHDYVIAQYHAFDAGGGANEDDIALLQLAEAVPAAVAIPDVPAGEYPDPGTTVTIYGYGCQERSRQSGAFEKQSFAHAWGADTENLCPGDSGGPTLGPDGAVLQINSAYLIGPGTDLFGDVVRNVSRLREYVDRWAEGETVRWIGEGGGGVDPMCATHLGCETCARAGCGWCGTCVAVDASGRADACPGAVVLAPEMCSPGGGADGGGADGGVGDGGVGDGGVGDGGTPPRGDCGHLSDIAEFTCATDAIRFVRCGPTGLEFLVCPEGYYCPPGSTEQECLWGSSGVPRG